MKRSALSATALCAVLVAGCRPQVIDGDTYRSAPTEAVGSVVDNTSPRVPTADQAGDHWHAAIGFDICGKFAPAIQSDADPVGIHTHGDGIIHVHPFVSAAAGHNARLRVFLDAVGAEVKADGIHLPGGEAVTNGADCDGRPAKVQVKLWSSREASDPGLLWMAEPGDIELADNQLITVAFLPDGSDIPKPPSEAQLDQLSDAPSSTTTTPATTPTTTPTTTITTTVAPPAV